MGGGGGGGGGGVEGCGVSRIGAFDQAHQPAAFSKSLTSQKKFRRAYRGRKEGRTEWRKREESNYNFI